MSFRTLEVDLEDGRVYARDEDSLPSKARALLTILETFEKGSDLPSGPGGLQRFLATTEFSLTPEQFNAAMESDVFEP